MTRTRRGQVVFYTRSHSTDTVRATVRCPHPDQTSTVDVTRVATVNGITAPLVYRFRTRNFRLRSRP